MFNEREALKVRLEQLVDMEEKIVALYREERKEIFNRLRELDSSEKSWSKNNDSKNNVKSANTLARDMQQNEKNTINFSGYQSHETEQQKPKEKKVPIQNKKYSKTVVLREATIAILKKYSAAVPLKQLKFEIESETGVEIKNISLFMTRLVNEEENIQKATHGQYMYINN